MTAQPFVGRFPQPARLRLRALSAAAALALLAAPQLAAAAACSFSTGSYSSSSCAATLAAGDTLAIVPGGYKYLDLALTVEAGAVVTATDHLYFSPGNTLNNAGIYAFASDVNLYNNGASGVFVNTGTLAKTGGTGDSYVSISGFTNDGGTVSALSGRIVFNNGATFNTGSSFTGPGQVLITGNANFAGNFTSDGSLVFAGGGSYTGSAGSPARLAGGTLQWVGGALAGSWQTAAGSTVNIVGGNYKYVNGSVANSGTMTASDNLYFNDGAVLTNDGRYEFSTDVHLFSNGGLGNFVNNGTLAKVGGTGDSYVRIGGFSNGSGGAIDAQSGRIIFDNGAQFASGSVITGAGQVVVTNGASFNGALSTAGNLYLSGGSFTANGVVATGDVMWTGGTLAGTWQTAAGSTLHVVGGGYKYVGGALTNAGTMTAADHLYFNDGTALTNDGRYELANDTGLIANGGTQSFVNSGTLAKVGGTGDSTVSVTGFTNAAGGSVEVQTGRIVFNNNPVFASGSAITGVGQVVVTNGAAFNGALSTAGNLYLSGGTYMANGVVATGDVMWTGGTLAGTWQTAAGSTLRVAGGGYKYVGGALTNAGTMTAADHLYFNDGTALTNDGRYELANDTGLIANGGTQSFVNSGTLAKVGGTGDSTVSVTGFTNAAGGSVDVQTGRIVFNNNPVFASGSAITGAGQVVATNGAAFNGALSTAGNLYLSGGSFTANGAVVTGGAHFTGGTLAGQWQSSGGALSIEGGGYKYAAGLTLAGRIVATDHLYASGASALTNDGRYELATDVGIYNGGEVVNNGRIVKTGGTGTSDLSGTALQNLGTLESQAGTLRLPDNFSNAGTLMGSASIQVNGLLTNNGHLAPGGSTATGTLTLVGNLSQGALGTLDIRLTSSSLSDMLQVNGTAAIGDSTLALSCFACALNVGDSYLLMASNAALTGTFGSVTASGFGAGFDYALDYSHANQVWLNVLQVGAVPEPSTYAMLLAGMGVVGWLARRRRGPGRG